MRKLGYSETEGHVKEHENVLKAMTAVHLCMENGYYRMGRIRCANWRSGSTITRLPWTPHSCS